MAVCLVLGEEAEGFRRTPECGEIHGGPGSAGESPQTFLNWLVFFSKCTFTNEGNVLVQDTNARARRHAWVYFW